ncbi:hypothetical protein [Ruegeria atlantica]|uniref:hypothetical protein n=1 Tax=Ruegeria atlantica TaxID=81569 RepID=UPI0024945B91|nr:hypothetical protein [Ruegeria atlantica]
MYSRVFCGDRSKKPPVSKVYFDELVCGFSLLSKAGSKPFMTAAGLKLRGVTPSEQLDTLGIQKIMPIENRTFAGFRWRDEPTVQEYLAQT